VASFRIVNSRPVFVSDKLSLSIFRNQESQELFFGFEDGGRKLLTRCRVREKPNLHLLYSHACYTPGAFRH
jgi:hypothetical protein